MDDATEAILALAVRQNFINPGQADLLREELFMFPGGNVIAILLRRGMISPDQARVLESGEQPLGEAANELDADFEMPQAAPSPQVQAASPSRPAAQSPLSSSRPSLSDAIAAATKAAGPRPPSATASIPPPGKVYVIDDPSPAKVTSTGELRPDDQMLRLFRLGRERGCSDLHISTGKPPYFRLNGKLVFENESPVTPEKAERWNLSVLTAEQQADLEKDRQLDFAFGLPGLGRYRANVFHQRLGVEGAYRFIPEEVPTIDELRLPKVLEKLTGYTQGLNLVTGPGGSGKTSTVAAMLEYINRHRHEHIITVEDPVEYIFRPQNCQVTQREVGTHTESFANALRTALRQDPDVIMIGELRDLETTSISITAAETGHLVFGTLHTSSAVRTVARILDVYPPAQRAQICLMVAESLRGIMSQQLVERKDGRGRVCAMEVLLVTTGVSQVIKEGKTHQLVSHMQSGRRMGMISMDDSLMELMQAGLISGREAYAHAENKSMFEMSRNNA